MRTRKHIVLLMSLLLLGAGLFAQPKQRASERIDAIKVAFITKRLDLSSEEAEKFWPVYNDYQDKRDALREEMMAAKRKVKNGDAAVLTDADYDAYVNAELTYQEKDAALMKEYVARFRKVLSKRKVALLLLAEEDFKKELLKRMSDKPDNPGGGKKGPKGGK